jgi:hypothetical protein
MEQKAAKYDEITARQRLKNKLWNAEKPELYQAYYEANKAKLNARSTELRRQKKAAKKAAEENPTLESSRIENL